jgi:polyisoprenoid-binding protein YceI
LIIIVPLWGQKTYKLIPSTSNKILIKGTSNLHDWESNVGQVNGDMSATLDGNTLTKIEKVSVKITVNSIKSGKGLMDSKTMDALKNEKFPYIIFQSSAVTISGKNNLSAVGQLSIAGVSQTKTIPVTYKISNDGSITIKGEAKIKMSDYAIKPPTAMMGMLTTGNDTDITFEVLFKP